MTMFPYMAVSLLYFVMLLGSGTNLINVQLNTIILTPEQRSIENDEEKKMKPK